MRSRARTRKQPCAALTLATAVTALLLLTSTSASATQPDSHSGTNSSTIARTKLSDLISRRLLDPRLGKDVQITITDAVTGDVLAGYRSAHPMTAASNMKIVTGVNALATLGPSMRVVTQVLSGSEPTDVILQGAGDPLLTASQVRSLAAHAASRLPSGIPITVHVDGDLFPPPTNAPGWERARVNGSIGAIQALAIHGDRSTHPSRTAGLIFTDALRHHGVAAHLGGNQDASVDAAVLARATGHSVARAVGTMLSVSDSAIAETLFRLVARARGLPTTWAGAREAAYASLAELGIDTTGIVLADGSGLSTSDRITSAFLTSVLRVARVTQKPRFLALFARTALPVAGRTGTLDRSFGRYNTAPSRCASGRVQAKTGTIAGTIALSGIARPKHGHERIFSIIVNHRPTRYRTLESRRALDGLAATIEGCWR